MTEKAKQKTKEKHLFSFVCIKKRHKFEIESEDSNNLQFDIPKMICPVCQEPVQLNMDGISSMSRGERAMENRRKANREASVIAHSAAARHAVENPQEKTKTLHYQDIPGAGGASPFNTPAKIPVRIIESIEEKFKNLPDE